ncbi:hypothetical protein WR25_21962 [Diploscapter pachys]|uniref:Uncharacterized protein n=1 Tax=Diploscapter pachys TaxID=2018661 RepID=A0A2A2M4X0_9BILA|nr:hypothetical protein WR25_21962 [Diploscapter pachys]
MNAIVCRNQSTVVSGPCDDCVIDTDPNGSSWTSFNSSTCNDEDPNAGDRYEPIITDLSNSTTCVKQFSCDPTNNDLLFATYDVPSWNATGVCSYQDNTIYPMIVYCDINGIYTDESNIIYFHSMACRNSSTV